MSYSQVESNYEQSISFLSLLAVDACFIWVWVLVVCTPIKAEANNGFDFIFCFSFSFFTYSRTYPEGHQFRALRLLRVGLHFSLHVACIKKSLLSLSIEWSLKGRFDYLHVVWESIILFFNSVLAWLIQTIQIRRFISTRCKWPQLTHHHRHSPHRATWLPAVPLVCHW